MLGHYGVGLLREIRRSGPVGERVLLGVGFEVSYTHAKPGDVSLPAACGSRQNSQQALQHYVCLLPIMLSTVMAKVLKL